MAMGEAPFYNLESTVLVVGGATAFPNSAAAPTKPY